MRDILIISDSHEQPHRFDDVVEYRQSLLKNGEVLEVIFLGDGLAGIFNCKQYGNVVLHAVRGNCDYNAMYSPLGEQMQFSNLISIGGYKIFITHGHLLSVKETKDEICRMASIAGADIVMFGHTHTPFLEYIKKGSIRGVDKDLTLFNPGALSGYDGYFGNLSVSKNGFLLSHGKYSDILKTKR